MLKLLNYRAMFFYAVFYVMIEVAIHRVLTEEQYVGICGSEPDDRYCFGLSTLSSKNYSTTFNVNQTYGNWFCPKVIQTSEPFIYTKDFNVYPFKLRGLKSNISIFLPNESRPMAYHLKSFHEVSGTRFLLAECLLFACKCIIVNTKPSIVRILTLNRPSTSIIETVPRNMTKVNQTYTMTNALQMVVVMGSLYDTYVTSNDSVTVLCFGESIHKARGMLQLTPLPLSVPMVMSPPASTKSPYHMMLLRQSRSQDYLIMIGLNDCEQVPSDWFTYVRNFDPNIEYHLLRLKWSNVSTEVDRYKHVNFSKAEFDYKKLKMVTHITPAISTSSPNITNYPTSSVVSGTMTTGTDILAPTSVGHISKTSYAPGSSTLYRPYTYVVGMCTYSCDAAVVPVNTSDPIQKQMLERQVKELKKLLTVNKTGLSSTRRRKESAIDLRISAKAFGFVGTVMLCTCIMIIISADIPRFSRAILHFKAQVCKLDTVPVRPTKMRSPVEVRKQSRDKLVPFMRGTNIRNNKISSETQI